MKKILLAAMAILSLCAVQSCDKDNPGEKKADDNIEGTWLMRADEFHFFDATFNSDGTYEWVWKGASGAIKDTGTYTYEDNTITMTPTKFYEADYENPGQMNEKTAENMGWSGPRTVTIDSFGPGYAFWHWKGDFMVQDSDNFRENQGEPIIVFRKGYDYKLKKADLVGTWENKDENGIDRIVLNDDDTFAFYYAWIDGEEYSVRKDTGTWSLSSNLLSLTNITNYASFKSLGYNKETGKNEYEMYEVDPETLEAVKWESYNYSEPLVEEYYLVLQDGKIITNKGSFTKKK